MDETGQTTPEASIEGPKQFNDLGEFQTEIGRMKLEEEKEGKTANFRDLDPSHLTEEDMQAYNYLLAGNQYDPEKYDQYRSTKTETFRIARSQMEFCAYLGNRWQAIHTKNQIEEFKRKQNENSN